MSGWYSTRHKSSKRCDFFIIKCQLQREKEREIEPIINNKNLGLMTMVIIERYDIVILLHH